MQKKQGTNLKGITKITLDLSAYSKGVYMLQLTDSKGKTETMKLVKE
jgi:hypothetical protein